MPATIYHIRAIKDYAVSLIELLRKDGAIEDLELKEFELSDNQKTAIDKELAEIEANPNSLQKWEEIKQPRTSRENMSTAAASLYDDYKNDSELTIFTQLDNEPFYEAK